MVVSDILLLLIFNALLVYGFYHATTFDGWESYPDEGYDYGRDWKNILWWVRWYGESLPVWLQKPIYSCPQCMASFHGGYVFAVYVFVKGYPPEVFWLLPFYILALSGLNIIAHGLFRD